MKLDHLNDRQRQAVTTTEGPLLVLAGAGSGKTRVLTHRIAYLIKEKGVPPYQILALTFTNKAAKEMRDRVNSLIEGNAGSSVWVFTFHGFCVRILQAEIDKLGYQKGFIIYDEQDQQSLIGHVIKDLNLNDKIYSKKMLSSVFSDAKNHSLKPERFLSETSQPDPVIQAYRLYQKRLKEANALDFDDLLLKTIDLFEAFPDVLEKYRDRFHYILVDEYQDTNLAQYHIVSMLAKKHRNLCVVGDDDQSIYAWRGADIRNILEFEKDFEGCTVIRLEQNYRSTSKILNAANEVIANNRSRKTKKLWTAKEGGEDIDVHESDDERDEAYYICSRIANGVRAGARYDNYAILYRTHAQSRVLEMMLKSFMIPYRVYGGTSFFSRAEVKDILAYLRLFLNPADDEAFLRVVNLPPRGVGGSSILALMAHAREKELPLMSAAGDPGEMPARIAAKFFPFLDMMAPLYAKLGTMPLSEFTEELLRTIGYDAYLRSDKKENYETRAEIVEELIGYIKEFEASYSEPDGDVLQAFLTNVALFSQADAVQEDNGCVNLMTLHSAKGLEFPVVFLCGMEDGLFPSSQSRFDPEKLEEERRLCYVGVTRAKEKLYLSYVRERMLYGQRSSMMPSQFLQEMGNALPINRSQPKQTFREPPQPKKVQESFHSYTPPKPTSQFTYQPVKAAAPKVQKRDFDGNVGEFVRHKVFGRGQILSISGQGSAKIVEIRFDNGVVKKLAAAFAPLEKDS